MKNINSLLKGLAVVIKHLCKPAVTLEYPEKSPALPEKFRGKHSLKGCIGCGTCVKVCPANAITIEKIDNKPVLFNVDYKKCIFCGNCQYYCPVKAINHGKEFELATDSIDYLTNKLIDLKEGE